MQCCASLSVALHLCIQPLPTQLPFIFAKTLYKAASDIFTWHLYPVQHDFLSGSKYVLVTVTADSAVHDSFSVQPVVKGVQTVQSTNSELLAQVIHCAASPCANESFAMQVSHAVLGGLPCAMMVQADLMSHFLDTAAEQTKPAVDSNMAHSRALSSILVPPVGSWYRAMILPASHGKAGGGSLHVPQQAVDLTTVPTATFAGQVSIPKCLCDSLVALDLQIYKAAANQQVDLQCKSDDVLLAKQCSNLCCAYAGRHHQQAGILCQTH